MAPAAVETQTVVIPETSAFKTSILTGQYKELAPKFDPEAESGLKGYQAAKVIRIPFYDKNNLGCLTSTRQYPHYLPTWDPNEKYPPLEPFEHYEHGKDADPTYPNLLPKGQVTVTHLTPTIGSEVRGIQLSKLSNAGKDELARFVAERKVVAFRDQDFVDLHIEQLLEFGSYFGRYVPIGARLD